MQSCLFEEENEKKEEEVKSYKEKPTDDEEKMVIEEEGLKRCRSRVQVVGGRQRLCLNRIERGEKTRVWLFHSFI